jgi:hypothetical protein
VTDAAEMIDRIVAGVLEQLHAPAPASAAPAIRPAAAVNGPLAISEAVITAAVLETRGVLSGPVVFAARAIVTPSAVDFLSSHKIGWTRATAAGAGNTADNTTATVWSVLVSRSTPAVESALDAIAQQPGVRWQRQLVGCHRESARLAVGGLCRGECDGVIAFTGKPDALACHANRNPTVRAAVIDTAERVKRVKRTVGANVFAVDPGHHSVFALRTLLREIVSGGKPALPTDWSE